jgi:hypothetical protein
MAVSSDEAGIASITDVAKDTRGVVWRFDWVRLLLPGVNAINFHRWTRHCYCSHCVTGTNAEFQVILGFVVQAIPG